MIIRPPYKIINPLSFWLSVIFVPFNFVLAIYLFYIPLTSLGSLKWVDTTTWSYIFFLIGAWLAYALFKENLRQIRLAMLAGLIAKLFWMYVLLLVANGGGWLKNLYVLDLWAFAATTQALIIIYFVPLEYRDGADNK